MSRMEKEVSGFCDVILLLLSVSDGIDVESGPTPAAFGEGQEPSADDDELIKESTEANDDFVHDIFIPPSQYYD